MKFHKKTGLFVIKSNVQFYVSGQFKAFMNYVKKLDYTETPDYEFLKDLLHSCYEMHGFSYNDTNFDWSTIQAKDSTSKFTFISNSDDSSVRIM